MLELGLFTLLLLVCWPLALLGALAYFGFWLFSVVLKATGALLAVVLTVMACVFVLVGLILTGIFLLPFALVFG